MFKTAIGPLLQAIKQRPHEFQLGEFRWVHRPTNLHIWIANDCYGLRIKSPARLSLGVWDRKRLWRAFNKWRDNYVKRLMKDPSMRPPSSCPTCGSHWNPDVAHT